MSIQSKSALFDTGQITVRVSFYSYFKDLTGCSSITETALAGMTLRDLFEKLTTRFPRLGSMRKSTLMAVGVDYQPPTYVLKADDEIALFPPVQGG